MLGVRSSLSCSSMGDTRRVIRFLAFSPIMTSKYKIIACHIPDAQGVGSVQDPIPQHHQVSLGPLDLRGMRGAQLGHLGFSLITDMNKQGLTPSICKHFGNRHRVIARGHLGKKGAVKKGPKASSLVVERIIVISMHHLIRP
jgi:hypothetical protein